MVNLIAGLIVAIIVGGASYYIYSKKKSGIKCIGCPSAKSCHTANSCSCSESSSTCSCCKSSSSEQ